MDTRPDALEEGFGLVDGEYRLSAVQAQAILDLRLHRLTGLEQEKILNEYKDILEKIKVFSEILFDPDQLLEVIKTELCEIRDTYGDERRTEINQDHSGPAGGGSDPRRRGRGHAIARRLCEGTARLTSTRHSGVVGVAARQPR